MPRAQGIDVESAFVDDGFALKALIAGKGDSLLHLLLSFIGGPFLRLLLPALAGLRDYLFRLISELVGYPFVRDKDLIGRQDDFLIAGIVRGNLRGLRASEAAAGEGFLNLLAARAGSVQVLLRVAFDLRRSALARFDFVAESAKFVCEMGLINGSGKLWLSNSECGCNDRIFPLSRSVMLKTTTCVWSCGAA